MKLARKRIFQPKELRKVISAIRKRLKVDSAVLNDLFIFEIGSRTGLRCQEMSDLLWSDVREDYVDVRAGKGGKPRQIFFGSKTKALFDELRDASSPRGGAEHVFRGQRGPLTRETISRRVKYWVDELKLPDGLTAHSLRHSYAVYLLSEGVDLAAVRDQLGHSHVGITSAYLHFTPSSLEKIKKAL